MPRFAFEALTATGGVEQGQAEARNEEELAAQLRQRGAYLVRSAPAAANAAAESAPAAKKKRIKLDGMELAAFTDYIASSLQVGIPLLTALEDTHARIKSRRLRTVVTDLSVALSEHGMSFSDALAEHPAAFSKLYVGTVAAGEASGHLDYALRQLADHLEWQQEIKLHVRQALLYPAFVSLVVVALMLTLLTFVYPRILPVVEGYDVELPWMTIWLRETAEFLRARWYVMLGGVAVAVVAFLLTRRTRRGRFALDRMALGMPVFGPLLHRINMARVVTYLALFYRTGVELIYSLTLIEEMIDNRRVAAGVNRVRTALVDGQSMTAAFALDPIFPPEVVRGVALGEATGAMDETLNRVRLYYAREVPAAVKRMLTALQPLLIITLGGLILIVALSIVLPIASIYQNLGGRR